MWKKVTGGLVMTYRNCKKLIEAGRYEYDDMMNKLDVFLLGDRITQAQYTELVALMDNSKDNIIQ